MKNWLLTLALLTLSATAMAQTQNAAPATAAIRAGSLSCAGAVPLKRSRARQAAR